MINLDLRGIFRSMVALFASLLLVACGGGVTGDANNFVVVDDQTVVELNQITLAKASVDREVCVVIFEQDQITNGVGTIVIGEKTLEPGEHENVIVPLLRESKNNESMYAELHEGSCASDTDTETTSDVVITQNTVSAVQFIITRSTVPYIDVNPQSIANVFNVTKVVADQSSWIVVHRYDANAENTLGDVVGYQLIPAGHASDVKVTLQEGLENTEELIVALYLNSNVVTEEDFLPVEDVLIEATISSIIEVGINTNRCDNCIHFTLENLGFWAYDWDGDASAKSKIDQSSTVNETITLTVGERYEINNPAVFRHPFELINSETQEALLSQKSGVQGTFEDDGDVNWTDDYGVMRFTLTQGLADQLSKYQCAVHPSMAGDIVIAN